MILKIDLEKTFDKLEWSLIRKTLHYLNFPVGLSNLIMPSISSSQILILFNKGKTDFFTPSRGIRQGEPMSSYIFALCMELLFIRIEYELDVLKWNPISIS